MPTPILTLTLLLGLAAFGLTLAAAVQKTPLWIPVLLLTLIVLIQVIPR